MKKVVLIIATLSLAFPGIAQEKYVVSANMALGKQNFDEAKENIDKAMASPETKDKPKTLFVKAETYLGMQQIPKYQALSPYREGTQALFKLIEVKPEYEKETCDQMLIYSGTYYYNDGVRAYNDKKYPEAIDFMKNVIKIHDMDGGKRLAKVKPELLQKRMDTAAADAAQTIAMSTQNLGKYEEAIPLLITVKNNPITRSAAVYETIIYAYNTLKKTTEANAMIAEARAAFPDDDILRNYELNSYITSGKQDELAKKLEEAAVKEPNNSDIQFNIATTYLRMAYPKSGPRPANSADLIAKSESAFQKAIAIAPKNPTYNYNFGALYFNKATDFNDQMNAITGTSDADEKKYNDLKDKRDGCFTKSMPYFETAYAEYSANEKNLKDEDNNTYKNTILALKEVYARQNKMDKVAEMKKKYESLP